MKTVTIKILSDANEQTPTPNGSGANSDGSRPSPNAKKTKEQKSTAQMVTTFIARKAYYAVKNNATQFIYKYFNASEMYKERVSVENAVSTIDSFVDIGTAAVGTAKLFSMVGASGVAGGVVGATVATAMKAIGTYQTLSNDAQKLIDSSYGNYFRATRAGFVAGGHDTEN